MKNIDAILLSQVSILHHGIYISHNSLPFSFLPDLASELRMTIWRITTRVTPTEGPKQGQSSPFGLKKAKKGAPSLLSPNQVGAPIFNTQKGFVTGALKLTS